MTTLSTQRTGCKNEFAVIANPFLQDPGLPFASVLDAESIQRVFREEEALFGQEDIFSTEIVLWAFLAQTLRDGKGVACSAAVADIATYLLQTGHRPPSGDTGDYCRARAKLSLPALRRLVRESARQLEGDVAPSWLWKGLHAKLVDGFTFTMPDTPENQQCSRSWARSVRAWASPSPASAPCSRWPPPAFGHGHRALRRQGNRRNRVAAGPAGDV